MGKPSKILLTGAYDQRIFESAKVASEEMGMKISRIRKSIADGKVIRVGLREYCLDYLFDESSLGDGKDYV